MFRFSSPVTLRLGRGELLIWTQGSARLRVMSGCAWVTQRNDLVDHFLHHGQCFELRRGQGVLISAEQDVWLRFERDAPWGTVRIWAGALWRRLTRRATPAATVAG